MVKFLIDFTGADNKLMAAKSMFGHMLEGIISAFNPETGKPYHSQLVMDWPLLLRDDKHSDSPSALGEFTDALASSIPGGKMIKYIGGKIVSKAVDVALGDRTITRVLGLIQDVMKGGVDLESYFNIYSYLDSSLRVRTDLDSEERFMSMYESHLRLLEIDERRDVIVPGKGTVDWYLRQLKQYGILSIGRSSPELLRELLISLEKSFDIEHTPIDGKSYILGSGIIIEQIRERMLRILEIDKQSGGVIHKDIEMRKRITPISDSDLTITTDIGKPIANFVGREEELKRIFDIHSSGEQIVLISAFGGTGKTSLALQYGNLFRSHGGIVKWFGEGTLEAGYLNMAEQLGINVIGRVSEEIRFATNHKLQLLTKAGSSKKILFVFDNLSHDNFVQAKKYIDSLPPEISLVVTTRDRDLCSSFATSVQEVVLFPFTEAEALSYAEKASDLTKGQIDMLSKALGTLPLRLSLAFSALKNDRTLRLEKYIERFNKMKEDGKSHPEIEIVLGQLLKMNEDGEYRAEGLAGWKLLQYLVYLNPDFVPIEIFENFKLVSEEELSLGHRSLLALSLVNIVTDASGRKGFNLHRFILEETKSYASVHGDISIPKEMIISNLVECVESLFPQISNMPDERWEKAKFYADSIVAIRGSSGEFISVEMANILDKMGEYQKEIVKNYSESLKYELLALDMRQKLHGEIHPDIASSMLDVGKAYQDLGKISQALDFYKKSLDMNIAIYGDAKIPEIAVNLCWLGWGSHKLGRNTESLTYLKNSMEIWQEIMPEKIDARIALNYRWLGWVYNVNDDKENGLDFTIKALEMFQSIYDGIHTEIAITLNNLAVIYSQRGDQVKALELYHQCIEMKKTIYAGNHPDLAMTLTNIGIYYSRLGEHVKALKYQEETLEMYRALYTSHPLIADILCSIGITYGNLVDYAKALEYKEQALEMYRALYPGNHANVANSLKSIGVTYESFGKYAKALEYKEQALEMYRALYPGNNANVANSLNNLGVVYEKLGDYAKALEYKEQALEMYRALYSVNNAGLANTLNGIGEIHLKLGDYAKALEYSEKSLEMYRALYSVNNAGLANSLNSVGEVYLKLGEYAKALEYKQQALVMFKTLNNPKVANVLYGIAEINKMNGNIGTAKNHFEQAYQISKEKLGEEHPDTIRYFEAVKSLGANVVIARAIIKYDNILLNEHELMQKAYHYAGSKLTNLLIELGREAYFADYILNEISQQGYRSVFDILLGRSAFKVGVDYVDVMADSVGISQTHDQTLALKVKLSYVSEDESPSSQDKSMIYLTDVRYNNHNQFPAGNSLVAGSGAGLMKLIEVKESIFYIFTDIIPLINKSNSAEKNSFVEKEGLWSVAHLAGGIAFSYSLPGGETLSAMSKILAPLSGTSSYVLRHYWHSEIKQNLIGKEAASSCAYNIVMDGVFGALTAIPVSIITANPSLILYGAGQGGFMAATSCFNSGEEKSWTIYIAGNIAAAATLYNSFSIAGVGANFGGLMIGINKLATAVTKIALVHKVVTTVTEQMGGAELDKWLWGNPGTDSMSDDKLTDDSVWFLG